jgi:hypothetical protein
LANSVAASALAFVSSLSCLLAASIRLLVDEVLDRGDAMMASIASPSGSERTRQSRGSKPSRLQGDDHRAERHANLHDEWYDKPADSDESLGTTNQIKSALLDFKTLVRSPRSRRS